MFANRWRGLVLMAVILFVALPAPRANSTDIPGLQPHLVPKQRPFVDYKNVGDQVDLYSGSLSVQQTDLTIPGIGPDIKITRSFSGEGQYSIENRIGEFGDWSLNIPRIEGVVALDSNGAPNWPSDRCSNFTQSYPAPNSGWRLEYNGEDHALVGASLASLPAGTTAVSKDFWRVSCLPSTENGTGEGFVARSPDGLKIIFNYVKYRRASNWDPCDRGGLPPYDDTGVGEQGYYRYKAMMLATQVSDRFGNTVNYAYNSAGDLLSITASDGRSVSFTYQSFAGNVYEHNSAPISYDLISSMTANGETWHYYYSVKTVTDYSTIPLSMAYLAEVTLPDGANWSFDLSNIDDAWTFAQWSSPTGEAMANTTGTIVSPSGVTATFGMATGQFATRSSSGSNPAWLNESPRASVPYIPFRSDLICGGRSVSWYVTANLQNQEVTEKQLSGPGINTQTWTYSRGQETGWFQGSSGQGTLPTSNTVSVTSPDGVVDKYTYSIMFDWTEGKILEHDVYAPGASTPSEQISYTYTPGTVVGTTSTLGLNSEALGREALLASVVDQKDGDSYTSIYQGYDSYNNPTRILRYNSFSSVQVTESRSYLNDSANWVLGLATGGAINGTAERTYAYSPMDQVTEEDAFGLRQATYTYNNDGTLASVIDGDNHATILGNYYRGIPQSIGYPDGTSKKLTVDAFGQVTSITDQAGHTTNYSYDSMGRISRIDYPYDSSVDGTQRYPKVFTYAYVTSAERGIGAGHWRRTVATGNAQAVTYFDAEMQPVLSDTSIVGVAGSDITTASTYDWQGHTTFTSYPVTGSPDWGGVTAGVHHSYDALGRLIQSQQDSEQGTLTTATQYLSGAGVKVTDPKGSVTTTYYQAFDRPAYGAPIQVQASDGVTQSIQRDLFGAPTELTQSGTYGTETDSVSKYLYYDSYHRLCRTTEPETGSTVLAYDGASNMVWSAEGQNITEAGCGQDQVSDADKTVRTYDAMNRLQTLTPPAGTQSTTYTYDALGNLSAALSGTTAWTVRRDSLGQTIQEALQVAGQNPWTLGYQYDAYGNLSAVVYPNGETVAYAPDALGRPTQAGNYVTGVGYFPNGAISIFTYGNGTSYVAEQNARQLLRNFSYGTDSALSISEDYAYDADGNITQVNDLLGGLRSKSFGYDALNRLTSATASSLYGTESYTYDPINNLRTRLTGGQTLTYNYDATNKLASITQGASTIDSLSYNAQGDTIGQNSTTLAFDAKHQLTGLPGVESYSYDAAGRRVMKQPASGSPTYYFYNQAGQLLYQWDTSANTSTNFIYLGQKLVAKNAQAGGANTGSTGVSVLFPPAYSTNGNYTVSWYSISGATSYELQTLVNGAWTTIYTGSANAYGMSTTAHGVYAYRVRACAGSSCGGWSATADVTVDNESLPIPPDQSPLLMVNRSNIPTQYTVLWAGVDNASSYNLQEQFQGGAWAPVYSGPNGSWDATNKPVGNYAYQAQACNSAGCGPWSPVVSIKVGVDISPIINLILDDN